MFKYLPSLILQMKKRIIRLPEPPTPSLRTTDVQGILFMMVLLLLIAFFGTLQYEKLTGKLVYRDSGYGYLGGSGLFGGFSFSDIYAQQGYLIDAALFLLIFLGAGKGIFKKHFAEGGTAVYTGIGIFLAFALLLWEERSGIYLLEQFGSFVVILFLLVLFAWVFQWMKSAGMSSIPLICIGYLALYWGLFEGRHTMYGQNIYSWIVGILPEDIIAMLAHIALLGLVVYFIWWFFYGRKKPSPPPSK